jgi:hypothetical protein
MPQTKTVPPIPGDLVRIPAEPKSKWVRIIAFGLLGVFVSSCLVCGYVAYLVRPKLFDDPVVAAANAKEILDFTPCAGYEPKGTIDWNVLHLISLRGVYYEHRTADGLLMILKVATPSLQGNQNVQAHIRNVLQEKNGVSDALIVNQIVEQLTLTVQGRQRDFAISKAKDPATNVEYRLLEGTVTSKDDDGQVLIGMRVVESAWNLDAVKEMLTSIK